MTALPERGQLPLVAVLSQVPLLGEGVSASLRDLAEIRYVPPDRCDVLTLLRLLEPDVVVIDSDESIEAAEAYAAASGCGLVQVELRGRGVRVHGHRGWSDHDAGELGVRGLASVLLACAPHRGYP